MKRCPQCRRDYTDETLNFCLDDGATLLDGPGVLSDPATAILPEFEVPPSSESATRQQIHTTIPEAEPPSTLGSSPERQSLRAAEPKAGLINRRFAFLIVIVCIALGGFFGYRYFASSNSKQVESIAVMPFVNDSGNPDIEYLSDGMTETLISSLTQLPNLSVKARSSVFRYKGKETDVKTLGKELNVQAILNGRVSQRGDQLTLNLELVDVQTENAIWSQQYSRKQSDIVSLQSQIAKEVSTKLKAKLSGAEETSVTRPATENPEAYQAYLKGRFYWNQRGQGLGKLETAIEQFRLAANKDPNYALAYAGLADCYALMPQETGVSPTEALPQAKAFANRALEIDESLSEAHATLGLINQSLWQWADAQKEFERSIELNPNYPTAHQWYSGHLGVMGRSEERFGEIRKAYELDPLSPVISINMGLAHLERKEWSAAAEQFNKTLEMSPNYFVAHAELATALLRLGKLNEALLEAQRSAELSKRHSFSLSVLGQVTAASGNRNDALALIKEIEQKPIKGESDKFFIAAIHAGLGDRDEAFAWLEKSFKEHNTAMTNLRIDPFFESLSDDPRFKDILRRMGLPE